MLWDLEPNKNVPSDTLEQYFSLEIERNRRDFRNNLSGMMNVSNYILGSKIGIVEFLQVGIELVFKYVLDIAKDHLSLGITQCHQNLYNWTH